MAPGHWIAGIFYPEKNKFIFLRSLQRDKRPIYDYAAAIETLQKEIPELANEFLSVLFLISKPKLALIPKPLYKEAEARKVLGLNYEVSLTEQLLVNYQKNLDAYLVFPVERYLENGLRKKFTTIEVLNAAVPFLQGVQMQLKNIEEPAVSAFIEEDVLYIAVRKEGRIVFFNSFCFKTREDLIYYLLFISNRFGVDVEKSPFYFCGYLYKNSDLFRIITQYIGDVRFLERPHLYEYIPEIEEAPSQLYFNLFAAPLCAS